MLSRAGRAAIIGAALISPLVFSSTPSPSHAFDFRGCDDRFLTVDSVGTGRLGAMSMNGASCSLTGIVLDGVDDYVALDEWGSWGGTTSSEVYAKFLSFNPWSRVFDFGNSVSGSLQDSVVLGNGPTDGSGAMFNVFVGSAHKFVLSNDFWAASVWTHVVAIVDGPTMAMSKNGVQVCFSILGQAPTLLQRSNLWIGRSNTESDGFFHGEVAYIRVWHDTALNSSHITELYNNRLLNCPSGMAANTLGSCDPVSETAGGFSASILVVSSLSLSPLNETAVKSAIAALAGVYEIRISGWTVDSGPSRRRLLSQYVWYISLEVSLPAPELYPFPTSEALAGHISAVFETDLLSVLSSTFPTETITAAVVQSVSAATISPALEPSPSPTLHSTENSMPNFVPTANKNVGSASSLVLVLVVLVAGTVVIAGAIFLCRKTPAKRPVAVARWVEESLTRRRLSQMGSESGVDFDFDSPLDGAALELVLMGGDNEEILFVDDGQQTHQQSNRGAGEPRQWLISKGFDLDADLTARRRVQRPNGGSVVSTAMVEACLAGELTVCTWILEDSGVGASVAPCGLGRTPTWVSCAAGHLFIVQWLYDNGADEDIETPDNEGVSPLGAACLNGHLNVAQWLCEVGADDVRTQNDNGRSPMLMACLAGHLHVAKWLITMGAKDDIFLEDGDGLTPMGAASEHGHSKVVDWLATITETTMNNSLSHSIQYGPQPASTDVDAASKVAVEALSSSGKYVSAATNAVDGALLAGPVKAAAEDGQSGERDESGSPGEGAPESKLEAAKQRRRKRSEEHRKSLQVDSAKPAAATDVQSSEQSVRKTRTQLKAQRVVAPRPKNRTKTPGSVRRQDSAKT